MTPDDTRLARELEASCAKVGIEKIRSFWASAQEAEKAFWRRLTPERMHEARRQWKDFAEFLHVAATQFHRIDERTKVLQVGTAVLDAIYFFPAGERYSADPLCDFYQSELAWAYESTLPVRAVAAPCERLPFDAGTFSFVILNNMLDHVFEPVTALGETRRILRDDGLLFVGVNVFPAERCATLRTAERDDPCHPYVFSPEDVLGLLRATGYHPVASKLHEPTDPAAPDERYFAVFALASARVSDLPAIPGDGWRRESVGAAR